MVSAFFSELLKFCLLYVIRPLLLLFGAAVSSLYNVLFAWWLDGWTFKGHQDRFESEIREQYSWLFEKYNARIMPRQRYKQVLDYVVATVAIGDLLLDFVRGNGDFRVNVAPAHAPHDWYDFAEAIDLASGNKPGERATHYRMASFRQLFEANVERLNAFFSKENYGPSRRDRTATRLIRL
jgi:hypothetical protein